MDLIENIDINIDTEFIETIDFDIDTYKEILQNIDIDKILYQLEFGISNRAICMPERILESLPESSLEPMPKSVL